MLTYNNTKIETLKFGETDIDTGIFNGVTVFEKRKENIVILRTTKQSIGVEVVTKKGSDLEVWNAGEKRAVIESGNSCTITLKDTEQDVIIKGHDIIRLFCSDTKLTSLNAQGCTALETLSCNDTELTSLNVQGCTALQELSCYNSQLTANAFKDIFINLAKTNGKGAAILYNDGDSNYKDFTQPPELAAAFNAAKAKGWMFYKNSQNNDNLS